MQKPFYIIILTAILILTGSATCLASWQVNLEISTPDPNSDTGMASNKLYIGTDPAATDGYDNKFDTIALLNGPVKAYISHPEYPSEQQKLWRDIRSDSLPKEWEIQVQSDAMSNSINISWGSNTPENLNFTFIDKESGQEIDITSGDGYSYSNNSTTPKKFLLKVSEYPSINPPADQGGGGASKGGGCGYIRGEGRNKNHHQIMSNLIILILPLLLPLQHYVRQRTLNVAKRRNE